MSQNIFEIDISLNHLFSQRVQIKSSNLHLSITGPSGTGKSSIAKAVAGIIKYNGLILFKGKELIEPAYRRNFAYLPQDLQLFPHLSAKENIHFPKYSQIRPEIIEALKLEKILERMPRHLSGGEKQRVSLARALSIDAELYILDEPFSSLDSVMKEQALQLVKQKTQDKALLLISHNDLEVQNLDCVNFSIIS
jgi:ABC-type molybdate transport system ATPase subunit